MDRTNESPGSDVSSDRERLPVAQPAPAEPAPYYAPGSSLDAPPQAHGGGMSAWLHAFRRRWFAVMTVGLVCAAVAAPLAWMAPKPQYTATAMLRIASSEDQIIPNASSAARVNYDLYKSTQQVLLKGDNVLTAALQDDRLANGGARELLAQQPDPFRWMADELKVDSPANTEIVRVRLSTDNAQASADIVNAVVDAYKNVVVDKESKARQEQLDTLTAICTDKEKELRNLRSDFEELSKTLGMNDSNNLALKQQLDLQRLGEYRKELIRLQFETKRLEGELALKDQILKKASGQEVEKAVEQEVEKAAGQEVEKAVGQADEKAAEQAVTEAELDAFARTDATTVELQTKLNALNSLLNEVEQTVQPDARSKYERRYRQDIESIGELLKKRREKLREEYKDQRRSALESEVAQLELQLRIATVQYEQFQKEHDALSAISRGWRLLNRAPGGSRTRSRRRSFSTPTAPNAIGLRQKRAAADRITKEQEAARPSTTDKDRQLQMAAMASMAGFFLPAAILFWDVRAKRINSPEEVSEGLGLVVLGSLPVIPARAFHDSGAKSRRHQRWQRLLAESINNVVVRLLREAREQPMHLVLISSAASGEGKTTLATQMAMSLARSGRRTLLVDCDLRRPALHNAFDVPLEPGVSELLLETAQLDDVVTDTAVDDLWLVTAGGWLDEGLEVLTGGAVETLFTRFRNEFEFVVIDGSPVSGADSRILAQHADAVILSVLRDVKTRIESAYHRILHDLGVHAIGSIVTGTMEEAYRNYTQHTRAPRAWLVVWLVVTDLRPNPSSILCPLSINHQPSTCSLCLLTPVSCPRANHDLRNHPELSGGLHCEHP